MRRDPARERGVALLMVIVAVAILAALAADFAYAGRVDLEMATHERDALQARYLASSGIGLSRLLLGFQKQLDQAPLNLPGLPGGLNLQVWKVAHVDCHLLQGLVPRSDGRSAPAPAAANPKFRFDAEFPQAAAAPSRIGFGSFSGCFTTQISDEQERINVNQLAGLQTATGATALQALLSLVGDRRYDFLSEHEDANRVRATSIESLLAVRDWADDDEVQSALTVTSQGPVLQPGFADEAGLYTHFTPRYRPKNAPFDTLDELYQVYGVNDRWMAAFRDRLTVWSDLNSGLNVNVEDPVLLGVLIRAAGDPVRPDPRLADPAFVDTILQKIRAARALSPLGMTVQSFTAILAASGVAVNPKLNFSDKSATFRIVATGSAGDVQRSVTAVVRITSPQDGLGRLLYWRED